MNNQQEEICGTIDRLVFKSPDSGYCVFLVTINSRETITVIGYLPSLQAGEHVTVQGYWTQHAKFGKQFNATQCSAQLPTTVVGIQKYLGSGLIKGIGPQYAKKIVEKFGSETLTIIEHHAERLKEVIGIGPKRIEQIQTAWHDQKEIATLLVFLQEKGISSGFASKIYKQYRSSALSIIQENPYRLAEDIWGIGFKSADACAQKLGFEKHSPKRIKAGIMYALQQITTNGHLYSEVDQLKTTIKELLELDNQHDQLITNALHETYEAGIIKLISLNDQHFIGLAQHYFTEKGLAQNIKTLLTHASPHTFDTTALYQQLRVNKGNVIVLNEDQQHATLTCLQHKITIITGGPGTGKTTLIKILLSLLDEQKIHYKLAAPTGRAAKRMMEGTGRYAETLHRLLEFDVSTMRFVHNEKNALKLDFLIVDEASMIDTFLMHALIKALPQTAHLVIIGDTDQLPSVGAGSILHDLIASNIISCVRLTQIFRQAQDSLIVLNAHRINKGEFPLSYVPEAKRDFVFIKENDPANIVNHLRTIYERKKITANNSNEMVVLTPMNRGIAGTINLNQEIQKMINPGQDNAQITRMAITYKLHDRVMQLRNNYDKSVFNGDIGQIITIDHNDQEVIIDFDGRHIIYAFDELNEIMLAYALSIHKSQGSEFDIVIIPLFMQHFMLLQRNLIYTGLTRAKKYCIFIGQPKALAIAIKNNKTILRKTLLKEFLTTELTAR